MFPLAFSCEFIEIRKTFSDKAFPLEYLQKLVIEFARSWGVPLAEYPKPLFLIEVKQFGLVFTFQ